VIYFRGQQSLLTLKINDFMERFLEGKVITLPHSYRIVAREITEFKLKIDKDKLDGLIMPDVVDIKIQEKVRIDKEEIIRGYFDQGTTTIFLHKYEILDGNGEPKYKNTIF